MPATGDLVSERFNGGADGVAITTLNSSIGAVVSGTPAFENTDAVPIEGSATFKSIMTALTAVRWDFVSTSPAAMYLTGYIYVSAFPSTVPIFASMQAAAVVRAGLKVNTTGQFAMNNVATAVYTSSAVAAAQWVRWRWGLLWGSATQTLDLYYGGALHYKGAGVQSGSGALTDAIHDRFAYGVTAAPAAAGFMLHDYLDISTVGFCDPALATPAPHRRGPNYRR